MKKLSTYLFLVLFSFQTPSWADDIRDFQIEGMSIGDSLLDYFSEDVIKNNKEYIYKSKKYVVYSKNIENSIYEAIQIEFKDNGEYIIESLVGRIYYDNKDFNKCLKQERTILTELENLFAENAKYKDYGMVSHEADPSGKSKGSWHTFKLNDGSGWIYLECMNWTKKMGHLDELKITILTSEFGKWLRTDGY